MSTSQNELAHLCAFLWSPMEGVPNADGTTTYTWRALRPWTPFGLPLIIDPGMSEGSISLVADDGTTERIVNLNTGDE